MDKKKILSIFLSLSLFFLLLLLHEKSYAGLFGDNVPEGKQIKDPYLEKLFAPEYPYEWVKVIDTKEGKRYVVIKAKQKINREMQKDYEEKTLNGKNVTVYRRYNPRSGEIMVAGIRLFKKVSDRPYVIQYCEASDWDANSKEKDIAWRTGRYFVLWIDREFSKKFRKLAIYPDKEATCPEPPFVGKYPNSVTLGCTRQTFVKDSHPYKKNQGRIVFTYVSKDEPRKIYDFFKDKLLEHFKSIGLNFPENRWEYNHQFGIQNPHVRTNIVDTILRSLEDKYILHDVLESNSLKERLPTGGAIFNIKIYKGASAENLIKEYSWIEILYDFEPNVIKDKMKGY